MGDTICETIEKILEPVQDEIDDRELSYKLRTARQLAIACQNYHEKVEHTLEDADLDQETVETLRDLGYHA